MGSEALSFLVVCLSVCACIIVEAFPTGLPSASVFLFINTSEFYEISIAPFMCYMVSVTPSILEQLSPQWKPFSSIYRFCRGHISICKAATKLGLYIGAPRLFLSLCTTQQWAQAIRRPNRCQTVSAKRVVIIKCCSVLLLYRSRRS